MKPGVDFPIGARAEKRIWVWSPEKYQSWLKVVEDRIQLHYRLLEDATERAEDPEEIEAIDAALT
eukprot:1011963-Karenia_brevis.AAC.1